MSDTVTVPRALYEEAIAEIEGWWREVHDEACTNMENCTSFGGTVRCFRPKPEILTRLRDAASTTHPVSAGKSILVVCCEETCLDEMRAKAAIGLRPGVVHVPSRYTVMSGEDSIQLVVLGEVWRKAAQKYDEIYTCGHVYLTSRDIDMLQTRLLDPASWPGYFSKFP